MARTPEPPERYAITAISMAIGALEGLRREGDGLQNVIVALQEAIARLDPRCDHSFGEACKMPDGGFAAKCTKCGELHYIAT